MHRKRDSKIFKKSLRCGFSIDHANPSMVRLRGCDTHQMWSIYPVARWRNIPPLCLYPIDVVLVDSIFKISEMAAAELPEGRFRHDSRDK